jgi:hypothetical protein
MAARDEDNNPRLTRKFNKWRSDRFTHMSFLVKSVMHPISKLRFESHVAVIRLNELPSGFEVLSAEAVSIESFPEDGRKQIRDIILSLEANYPQKVCCVSINEVDPINSDCCRSFIRGCGIGDYFDIVDIKDEAASENGRQAELIKMLNKKL